MKSDLIRIHHQEYQDDIPFWISITENLDPVLEVGSGHGRVTLPLLGAGHEVIGVDIDLPSTSYLQGILNEKIELKERARIFHLDLIDFHPDDPLGAVIIPCNTYSTFSGSNRRILIKKIFKMLRPGGILAASLPNPSHLRGFHADLERNEGHSGPDLETSIVHPVTGYPVQISSSLELKEGILVWHWIYDHLFPDGQVKREIQSTEHYLADLESYLKELNQVGFKDILCLGDFEGSVFSEESPYLIFKGMK